MFTLVNSNCKITQYIEYTSFYSMQFKNMDDRYRIIRIHDKEILSRILAKGLHYFY